MKILGSLMWNWHRLALVTFKALFTYFSRYFIDMLKQLLYDLGYNQKWQWQPLVQFWSLTSFQKDVSVKTSNKITVFNSD